MAAVTSGVEVCLDELEKKEVPHCPHGPALLFERCTEGQIKRFYACSACRDRKECSFFQWADVKLSRGKSSIKKYQQQLLQYSQKEFWKRRKIFGKLPKNERRFCQNCGLLLLPGEEESHVGHTVINNISFKQLQHPSQLLAPLDNKKKNAQYLFSAKAVEFTITTLEKLGFNKVLCVGAPRIHEVINGKRPVRPARCVGTVEGLGDAKGRVDGKPHQPRMKSLLLDIDHRFAQFYSPHEFSRYNMFNHHFFEGKSSVDIFTKFMKENSGERVIIVTDPPFGGLVEVIAHTIRKISQIWQPHDIHRDADIIPVFWYFPYFMEPRILSCLPSFQMLDYKVDYENHSVFKGGAKGRKHGSPVRIFTNISPGLIELPSDEGYRFCEKCSRYVAAENVHCEKCGLCSSKDGHTYRHCDECARCVKPSRVHCSTCELCLPADHKCGEIKSAGCYICGAMGHKRRECPQKTEIFQERKRKKRMVTQNSSKKRKH